MRVRENAIAAPDLIEERNRLALEQEQPGVMLVLDNGFNHFLEPLDDFFLCLAEA